MSQTSNNTLGISPLQARQVLWRKGKITDFLLDSNQKLLRDQIKLGSRKTHVAVFARQMGKCIHEDTLVMTPTGSVKIKNIKPGDMVIGYNADGTASPTEVKAVYKQGVKPVIDLTHRGRKVATATRDHRWLAYDSYKESEIEKTTEEILEAKRFKVRKKHYNVVGGGTPEPHAYSIAALLGDGCSKQGVNQIHISSGDSNVPTKIANELGSFLTKAQGGNHTWMLKTTDKPNTIGSKVSCNYYEEWCNGRYAHEKIADLNVIRTWDRMSQLRFIAGLVDTEGSIFVTGGSGNELKFSLSMQAQSVVDTLQSLFLDLWQIELCINLDDRDKYKNGPCHTIYTNNNFNVKRFLKELSPYLVVDKKKYKEEYDNFPEYNTKEHFVGVVRGDEYEAETYDLAINNGTHLFLLANGLVTHNSYCALAIAVEECIAKKNYTACYVAPRLKQGKKIVKMNLEELLRSCPPEMKPRFDRDSSSYIFPTTGSKIELYGFNAEEIESARGPKANLIIVDECGFMTDLKYGLRSVLRPKLNSTRGAMVLVSTLPKSRGHEFWDFVKKAEYGGTLIEKNIYDCERYTKDDIDIFAEECGGYESVDFQREYLNIMSTDEDHAVIPEAGEQTMAKLVKEYKRPPYFDPYVSMDIGVKDLTGILFAYYDFMTGKVVIEDEATFKGRAFTTTNLATSVKEIEGRLWGLKKPYLRVADNNNLILLNDLGIDHNLAFMATAKDNKHAWINQIRILISEERLIINPRCKQLIFHLKNATWNKNKTEYERSLDGGHYDLVDALAYLIRNIAFSRNPYPKGYGMMYGDSHMRVKNAELGKFEAHILSMFSTKKN